MQLQIQKDKKKTLTCAEETYRLLTHLSGGLTGLVVRILEADAHVLGVEYESSRKALMNRWRAPSCSPLPSFHSDLCRTFGRFSRRGQNLACLSSSLLIAVRWLMSADEMKSVILFLISEVKFWFSINPLSKGQRSVWES